MSFLSLPCSIKAWTNCRETPGWYWDEAQQSREQGEEKAERDLGICTNPIRAYTEDGASLLSVIRKRSQVASREIPTTLMDKVFTGRAVKRWQRLRGDAEEFPCLVTLPQPGLAASPALWMRCHCRPCCSVPQMWPPYQ